MEIDAIDEDLKSVKLSSNKKLPIEVNNPAKTKARPTMF